MDPNNQNNAPAIAGAITYPVEGAEGNVEPVPVQPRQPQNLQVSLIQKLPESFTIGQMNAACSVTQKN